MRTQPRPLANPHYPLSQPLANQHAHQTPSSFPATPNPNPPSRFFVNCLAEEPETVAEYLVPRIRAVPEASRSRLPWQEGVGQHQVRAGRGARWRGLGWHVSVGTQQRRAGGGAALWPAGPAPHRARAQTHPSRLGPPAAFCLRSTSAS